jgi:hypothetical protein
MANKPRPRCPKCGRVMEPAFRKREKGKSFERIPDAFTCRHDETLGKGRRRLRAI